ncbi:hypothetical protein L207DRAFT_574130 [Hyaloscypha variabilis F]|uniref:Uncharacterized protein n=1 Tax=Hyaloscypha variabilis (strain UAMH 11265 / GT02V1 / F) TaxID=1149755 RepID=A0A2J6QTD8_HYAVF|nr:hypothetical protein L207DRAFT_574130 [Hyaloscypha variabilis F]
MTEMQDESLIIANGQELVVLGYAEIKFRSAKYWWKRYTMNFFIVEESLPLPVILGNRFMGFTGIFLVDKVLLPVLVKNKRVGGEESKEAAKRREEEAEAEAAAQEENKDSMDHTDSSGESRRDDSNGDSSSSSGTVNASTQQTG